LPRAPVDPHFKHDLLGKAAEGSRLPGPLLQVPQQLTKMPIDPRAPGK